VDEVTRDLQVDSDPERAWKAISEESELSEWLGGDVSIDLKPGGEVTVTDDGAGKTGFVESVEEGSSVSFWWSEEGAESTRVELEVVADPAVDGCVIRVTESRPLAGIEGELADITACAV
jgi:uncharacterized protein YndB with AHSA1/START domain